MNLTENGDVVVVHLIERPAVATIETNGIKAFDKQEVEKSLRAAGLAEGRIFNSATLDKQPRNCAVSTSPKVTMALK